jgi:adenine-specific DNA-methyltransferase
VAHIDDLITEITDPQLRSRIEGGVSALRQRVQFGLSFERHIPEHLALPNARIRVGARVGLRQGGYSKALRVISIRAGVATCVDASASAGSESTAIPVDQLVVLKRTGEPVYPALRFVDGIDRKSDARTGKRHVLIEGDNHGVLQLLRWTSSARFDCIYIDPPYNTGARDWKYNNNYVDSNDTFKSSKWLSMMERRLRIARSLLKPDGVLIVAIDDYE